MNVAVDPGVRGCGVSVFGTGHRLAWAGYVKNPAPSGMGISEAIHMAHAVRSAVLEVGIPSALMIEVPRIYTAGRQKGDQNDVLAVAGFAYAIAMRFEAVPVFQVYPREWKGTGDADVLIARIPGMLDEGERYAVKLPGKTLAHNVWDAVGLGLYACDRLKFKKVYGGIE